MYLALFALHVNNWLYHDGRIFHNSRIFLQKTTSAIGFVSKQPNTVDMFRNFEVAYQCMEMLNKRWYHIRSHQHCPSSVLRLRCPSICVSVLRTTNGTVGLVA